MREYYKFSTVAISLALILASGCSKKDEVKSTESSEKSQTSQIHTPSLVNEKRVDNSTEIESFKLFGFTLGDAYSGTLGHDWAKPQGDITDILKKQNMLLRPDIFGGSIFSRLVAPDGMGEIGLLLTPKTKKIISVVLVKELEKPDLSIFTSFLNQVSNGCDGFNVPEVLEKIKLINEFSISSGEDPKTAACEFSARGSFYKNQYFARINIGKGESKEFRNGQYAKKTYKPANIMLEWEDGLVSVGFTNSQLDLTGNSNENEMAIYAKTGLLVKNLIKEDIDNLVAQGDPKSILAAAKNSKKPNDALDLLKKIEDNNIDAKLMAGRIYLNNFDGASDERGKIETSVENSIKEAFSRIKSASDSGNKDGMILMARMYERGFGTERNLSNAAKLLLDSGGINGADFFNFCQRNDSLKECESITEQVNRDRANRLAAEIADIGKFTIIAACSGPAKEYVGTIMQAMASSPMAGVQAINAQSRFCSSLNTPLQDKDILLAKTTIASANNGAKFFVSKTKDPNIMVGLVRRPD